MQTITVKQNQTIYDIAVQYYGTLDAVAEILNNNPGIQNDKNALVAVGVDYLADSNFFLDIAVEPGFKLLIDNSSNVLNNNIIKEIDTDITTFNL